MSFFEPPPPPDPPETHRQPAWIGPPENEAGATVAARLLLVHRDDLVLLVTDVVAYSSGFSARLALRRRADDLDYDPLHPLVHRRRRSAELSPEQLRFGIEFADGRRATNVGGFPPPFEDAPAGPVLVMRGGGGGGRSWDYGFWIWPLPPPGLLAFVAEWPAEGVEVTRREIDAGAVLEAARQSEAFWPADDTGGATGANRIRRV
jgi:hypothetical protein